MKNQRRYKLTLLSILLTAAPLVSHAALGGSDGGGGGAVLCLNVDHSVKSARLVDLVEASFYEKLTPSAELVGLSWQAQAQAAARRITFMDPDFHQRVIGHLASEKTVEEALKDTRNTDLFFPAPQDLSLGRTPPLSPGCQIVGAAVYTDPSEPHDPGKLRLSHLVWKSLSERDKAGLILHEALYLAHREIFETLGLGKVPNSADTRVLVGLAFSNLLDGHPGPRNEPARFNRNEDYVGFRLAIGYDEESAFYPEAGDRLGLARAKLYKALRNVLPFLLLGASRPLYLHGCKEGYTIGLVDDRRAYRTEEPQRRCELRLESYSVYDTWNDIPMAYGVKDAKGELVKPFFQQKKGLVTTYKYKFLDNVGDDACGEYGCGPELRQKLTLKCESKPGVEDFTPPFTIYCGKKSVATTEKGPVYKGTWGRQVLPIFSKRKFAMD